MENIKRKTKYHFNFPYAIAGWNYIGFATVEAVSYDEAIQKVLEIAKRKNPAITVDEIVWEN